MLLCIIIIMRVYLSQSFKDSSKCHRAGIFECRLPPAYISHFSFSNYMTENHENFQYIYSSVDLFYLERGEETNVWRENAW